MGLFAELSVLITVAALMAVVMRILRQPLIIGHILTGLVVGPFVLNVARSTETLSLMGEVGVAILLFTVGLHLSTDIIKQFGKVAFMGGIGQVIFTTIIGFSVCRLLGFGSLTSFYIAIALAFSSTIIVLKLISDRGDLDVLYAKIAIGFLLVQDIVAILLLLGIPLFSASDASWQNALRFFATGVTLIAFIYLTSRFFISKISSFIESSQEFLFLFAITWGIGIAALFGEFGFSVESGALIAGITLASLPSRHEISARLMPLRDFFIIIFFIFLGSQLNLYAISTLIWPALALSALILIGNPLILMSIMGYLGYRKKTSLQTGLTVAQVSEFSLILIGLGVSLGHVDPSILSLVTLVGIITIFGSTYLIMYSDRMYKILSPYLDIFERAEVHEPRPRRKKYDVMLFGCNRIGYDFLEAFIKLERRLLVVDYDPDIIAQLKEADVDAEFGDASNIVFLETLDFSTPTLIISTIPDAETNALIYRSAKAENADAVVIVVAHRVRDALSHYDEGIDYVILPHFLGAKHAADLIVKYKENKSKYSNLREEHIEHLQLRVSIGHEHPAPGAHAL